MYKRFFETFSNTGGPVSVSTKGLVLIVLQEYRNHKCLNLKCSSEGMWSAAVTYVRLAGGAE